MPSLDAAADTALALTTIDESLDTGQRDPRRTGRSAAAAAAQGFRHTSRFSRRLQLGPGLVPPSSWSLSPCIGPGSSHAQSCSKVQILARFISPQLDLREIFRSGVALFRHVRICVRMIYAGSRSESVRRTRSTRSRPADRGRVSNVVTWRDARLVGQRATGMVGPGTRSGRTSEVDQSRTSSSGERGRIARD